MGRKSPLCCFSERSKVVIYIQENVQSTIMTSTYDTHDDFIHTHPRVFDSVGDWVAIVHFPMLKLFVAEPGQCRTLVLTQLNVSDRCSY